MLRCFLVFFFFTCRLFSDSLAAQEFRVQIAAFEQRMAPAYFREKGVEQWIESTDQFGLFRYVAGVFPTRLEADEMQRDMIARGFPFATVVDVEEQQILRGLGCPYFRNGVLFVQDAEEEKNMRNVYFDFAQADFLPESKTDVDFIAERLKQNPALKLKVMGYTDGIGDPIANVDLASERARVVRNYLINKGIRADRMFIKVFGEADPAAPNGEETLNGGVIDLPENRRWNRRVVLQIEQPSGVVKPK